MNIDARAAIISLKRCTASAKRWIAANGAAGLCAECFPLPRVSSRVPGFTSTITARRRPRLMETAKRRDPPKGRARRARTNRRPKRRAQPRPPERAVPVTGRRAQVTVRRPHSVPRWARAWPAGHALAALLAGCVLTWPPAGWGGSAAMIDRLDVRLGFDGIIKIGVPVPLEVVVPPLDLAGPAEFAVDAPALGPEAGRVG